MKRIFFLVAILYLFPAPLWARQWTARSGGFTVEAELVDVRDGKAVLKKADGAELSVPLNKLSLSDVRFVEETLKAADARLAGKDEPAGAKPKDQDEPTEAEAEPQEEGEAAAKPAPKSPGAQKLDKLGYAWKQGQTFIYRTTITIDQGNSTTELAGDFTYKVNVPTDEGVELQVSGYLHPANPTPPSSGMVIVGHRSYHVSSGGSQPDIYTGTVTVDPHGRAVRINGSRQLPELLGEHASMILEPLPSPRKARWSDGGEAGGAVIVTLHPFARFLPTMRRDYSEGIDATEKTSYKVEGVDDRLITVSKHYELTTSAMVSGQPKIEATGDGKWRFDTKRGVPSSLDYQLRITTRERTTTEVTPVRLVYRLLSEEEQAKITKQLEEIQRKAEEAVQERQRPMNETDATKTLSDLKSGDHLRVQMAIMLLAQRPASPADAKLVPVLESLVQSGENEMVRSQAIRALQTRSRPQSAAVVVKALSDEAFQVRNTALEMISQFSPEKHIPAIAALLDDHMCQEKAARILKGIGPAAENAVLEYVNSSDQSTQRKVCEILGQIGTKKSLPALEKIAGSSDRSERMVHDEAKRAISAIKVRSQAESETN